MPQWPVRFPIDLAPPRPVRFARQHAWKCVEICEALVDENRDVKEPQPGKPARANPIRTLGRSQV
jgi:hypothetical protein